MVNKCICRGNLRDITAEKEQLFDHRFIDERGNIFIFVGVVVASDDYYYLMCDKDFKTTLLSCVGSIESFGYTQLYGPLRKQETIFD